jgi:hypothetical protein
VTTLAVQMSPKMARLVATATDILKLPTNQDFALKAMGVLLRSMGLAPKTGRPMGYSQRRRATRRRLKKPLAPVQTSARFRSPR